MNSNIQIFPQLSKIDFWNQHSKKMEQMCNERYYKKEVLSCVTFARLLNVINKLPELDCNFVK